MNAGTALGEAKDALLEAELVLPAAPGDAAPTRRWLAAAELGLSYRRSELPEGAIVTAARWRVSDGTPGMRERLAEVLAYRKRTQPLTMPSCGSVFANPPGDHAGRLIEAAGLKGRRVGGAQVSEQHANWIVNTGAATAADMRALMALCVAEVAARFGVTLRHEVRLLGDWEP
jgi:UDP-N-acetylmuramate dehydrogenase